MSIKNSSSIVFATFVTIFLTLSIAAFAGTPTPISSPISTPTGFFGFGVPTGFATISNSKSASFAYGISFPFDKEYTGVTGITLEGTPGGEFCGAAVRGQFYDVAGNKVAEITTPRTAAHQPASAYQPFSNVKVYSVIGNSVPDNDFFSYDCGYIDYLKATLTYTPSTLSTKTVSQSNSFVNKIEIPFDKIYTTSRIEVKATPGGEFCSGAITAKAYDEKGNLVQTIPLPQVGAHSQSYSARDVPSVKVAKIAFEAIPQVGAICPYVDYGQATLHYTSTASLPTPATTVSKQLGTCAKFPLTTVCSPTQTLSFDKEYTVDKIKFEARPGGDTFFCKGAFVTFAGVDKNGIPTVVQTVAASAQNWGSSEIKVDKKNVKTFTATVTSGCAFLDDIKVTLTPSSTAGTTTPPPQTITLTAGTATSSSIQLSWNYIPGSTDYMPQYRGAGTTAWSNAPIVTTTSTTVGGLVAGNTYNFQVIGLAVVIPIAVSNIATKATSSLDTTNPTVTVTHSPSSPKVGDTVTVSASASDASGIAEINMYVYQQGLAVAKVKTCTNAVSCSYSTGVLSSTYSGKTIRYYAEAKDKASPANTGSDPLFGTKGFTVATGAAPTTPTVSVIHSPSSPQTGQIVTFTATATGTFSKIKIWVDDVTKLTCNFSPCTYTTSYGTAVNHFYLATLEDSLGKIIARDPATGTKTFGVSAPVTANQFTLTVSKLGTGTGTITSSPSGISCGAMSVTGGGGTCSANFNSGTSVTLTATPEFGSSFSGWGGACGSATGGVNTGTTCTLTMNSAKTVTATFSTGAAADTTKPTVSVSHSPTSPQKGQLVTFTATASDSSGIRSIIIFVDYVGERTCQGISSCAFSTNVLPAGTHTYYAVAADNAPQPNSGRDPATGTKSVTVSAGAVTTYTLAVTSSGTGTGTITSSPSGINCGIDCTESYNSGTSVTLTANPEFGSTFAGWGGCDAISSLNECRVTMNSAKSVTATFSSGAVTKLVRIIANVQESGTLNPIPRAQVLLLDQNRKQLGGAQFTDNSGKATFTGEVFKTYTLLAEAQNYVRDERTFTLPDYEDFTETNVQILLKKEITPGPGVGTSVSVNLDTAWNLISLPGDFRSFTENCPSISLENRQVDTPLVFFFNANTQEYSDQTTFAIFKQGGKAIIDAGKFSSFWAYTPSACKIDYTGVTKTVGQGNIKISTGWNFIPLTDDMKGQTLNNLGKDCKFDVAYAFNSKAQNWQTVGLSNSLSTQTGLVVYSDNACVLGGGIVPPQPPKKEEEPPKSKITPDVAVELVTNKFNEQWEGVQDGCGDLEVQGVSDTGSGYKVEIKYSCGFPSEEDTSSIGVSYFGDIENWPWD